MNNNIKLINSLKTVFRKKDILNILDFKTDMALDKFLYRAKEEGFLKNVYYWIYTLQKYDILELASKIKKKSYISLETVLKKQWVIFQYYDNVFLVSDNSLSKKIEWVNFIYHKIKDSILLNPLWIENNWKYMIACKERAICDRIYLSKNYYFDNLDDIDHDKLEKISKIYENKRVILEIKKLRKKYVK